MSALLSEINFLNLNFQHFQNTFNREENVEHFLFISVLTENKFMEENFVPYSKLLCYENQILWIFIVKHYIFYFIGNLQKSCQIFVDLKQVCFV